MVTKVNILVGRFQPLTRGHLKCIDSASLPTVICMIDTPETKVDPRHPFPSSVLLPMYKELLSKNKMVKDIILVKNANIVTIGAELASKGYVIGSWSCGTDRYKSYKDMSDRYHEQAGLADDFEVIEIKRTDEDVSATQCREAIKKRDKAKFITLFVPISLRTELKYHPYDTLCQWLGEE